MTGRSSLAEPGEGHSREREVQGPEAGASVGRSPRSRQGPVLAQDQPRGEPQEQTGPVLVQDQQGGGAGEGRGRASERSAAGGVGLLCSAQGEACRCGSIGRSGRRVGARAGRPQQRGLARGHDEPTGTERTEAARARRGGTRAPRARGSRGGGKQRDRGRRLAGRLVRVPGRDVLPSTPAIGSLAQAAPVTRLRSHRSHPAGLPGATAPAPRRLRRSAMRSAVGSSHAHSRALTGRPKGNAGADRRHRTGPSQPGRAAGQVGDRGRQARDRSELRKCDQGRSPAWETRGDV